ncbi:MAG: polyprenyl synthetase family protein [Candidatus Bathyarchaeota archaeon]|nr:polyprenyl synthetase family protein [Candidatus Bathyarchaeota archaeon]
MDLSLNLQINKELKEISAKVKEFLNEALPLKEPKVLYEASTHLIKAGGKMLRPYLTIKACEAVGGTMEKALPAAASIELLHTFTLIHDDIMDDDLVRRGVPSVHAKWGLPVAIMAGDLLFAEVYKVLAEKFDGVIPPKKINKVINILADTAITICEGQTLDVSFPHAKNISEKDYIDMISRKTSQLFKASAEVGAIVGNGKTPQVKRLGKFAGLLGIAFQIVDDVLGLEADEKTLGKPVGSDLREGKKTILVIYAFRKAKKKQKEILFSAMRKDSSQEEILEAKKVIEELGSVKYAMVKAEKYVEKAKKQLEKLPETNAKKSLLNLADFILKRNF